MISLRTRRATLLPSTLTFAVLCHAGLASAQTPAGWPFDDKDSNSASQQAPQPKSAVQLRLEELYRRDGRPLPDYMRQGGSQPTTAQQPQQQQQAAQRRSAQQPVPAQYQSPAQYATPSQTSVQYAAPQQPQVVRPMASQGNVAQQLSDYYASQGKTMPGAQPSWNGAEQPRQQPVTAYSPAPQAPAPAPAPQPGFFERLWRKDTPATPQTSVQVSGYAPVASATPQPAPPQPMPSQPAPAQSSGSLRQPAPAPLAPPVVHAQPVVRHSIQTVDLGSSAPIEALSQPSSKHPAAASQSAVASKAPQKPSSVQATHPSPSPSATVAAKAPVASTPAQPTQATPQPSASGVATVRDETPPFDPKTESEADKKAGPYTGLKLDTDEAVTSPNPTRVTTANVNEPAERPRQAPMPVVDADPSAKPITQPKVAAHAAAPAHPSAEDRSGTVHLEDTTPAAPQPSAPKVFVARHPATQLPPTVDDSAAEMHKVGERVGQHGMKGFCPVALREQRQLVDAVPVYSAIYQSKRYYFSSAEALAQFEQTPQKYAPVAGGADVVVQANSEQTVNGTLDFAVWYKDRLFLFSSPESAEAFSLNPHPYASPYLTGK
jgi:YHS domain-containing protein